MAYVAKYGEVLSRIFTEEQVKIHCRIPKRYIGKISDKDAEIISTQSKTATEILAEQHEAEKNKEINQASPIVPASASQLDASNSTEDLV